MINFLKTFISKQFIYFLIIGVVNTFNGVIFSYIYSSIFNENLSFVLGYISGLFISYLLNSFITFRQPLSLKKFINFSVSYIPNFIIQNVTVFVVFNILGYHKLLAYILAAVLGVPITFLFLKFFAFKTNKFN
ncbi:GtrA family protein [Paraclostridium sordellii]|uniref:GtrA family protein n=1 Tax=Paraclostridium sordellii TaxID=1505 RepID=UPI0005E6549F|nr:GtrA family protein [Paeniclostridium sordellii]CEP81538.1 GtrA family protein [[Clostridium] sordellii] [Paeniclostridium sordellii]